MGGLDGKPKNYKISCPFSRKEAAKRKSKNKEGNFTFFSVVFHPYLTPSAFHGPVIFSARIQRQVLISAD